jgi:hypothetical protein
METGRTVDRGSPASHAAQTGCSILRDSGDNSQAPELLHATPSKLAAEKAGHFHLSGSTLVAQRIETRSCPHVVGDWFMWRHDDPVYLPRLLLFIQSLVTRQ